MYIFEEKKVDEHCVCKCTSHYMKKVFSKKYRNIVVQSVCALRE